MNVGRILKFITLYLIFIFLQKYFIFNDLYQTNIMIKENDSK